MEVEDKKYYLAWGYKRFADYLNSDEVPDLSKNKYYELKTLLESEGSDVFDVFSGKKIPVSTRKLLAAKGVEISLEGDDLVIADKRVPVTDRAAMKELVETVHGVLRERDDREEKLTSENAKLKQRVQVGQDDYEQLQRNLDAMKNGDPYQEAFAQAIYSLGDLSFRIGQLPDARKADHGPDALETLWAVVQQVRKAYNVKFNFTDAPTAAASSDLDDIAAAVLADDEEVDD
jgi:hypothetical protein